MPDMTHVAAFLAACLAWFATRATQALATVRDALHWASVHTGLPVVLVAAIGVVLSWRVFRHTVRFAIEVAVATALLLLAKEFWLLRW